MPTRSAKAVWEGSLKEGSGRISVESKSFESGYSFRTRFENATGTNPEELLGAAHAGCFSMALASNLAKAGLSPKRIETTAKVTIDKVDEGFAITTIDLVTRAEAPGADDDVFQEQASRAKESCPVSRALAGVTINLDAKLTDGA